MSRQVKVGTDFYPAIDSDFDILGVASKFSYNIVNMADGSEVTNSASDDSITEVMYASSSNTATTNGVAVAGAKTFTVATGNTITAGEVIDDGVGNLYYVVAATDTSISVKRELKADIGDTTTINTAGNTGVYKLNVNLPVVGEYLVIFHHTEGGRIPVRYIVVENTIDDVAGNLESDFQTLSTKLDSLGAATRLTAIA